VTRAEQITDPITEHGEGPVWSSHWGKLRWVDMLAGDVLELDDSCAVSRTHVGSVAAVIRPRLGGGAVVALEDTFSVTDGPLTELRPLPRVITDAGIRMNEGGCDPAGNFYCGSMAYDQSVGAGSFYRLGLDGSVQAVFTSVTISNGFSFSPDQSRAYYIDTHTHRVDVFDYAPSTLLSNRRPWVSIPTDVGGPDGLCVDADEGKLDGIIDLPVRQVTACAFGPDRLYITTSRIGLGDDAESEAGALFAADVGVAGLETLPYGA